ncbi:hypothetical protein MHK_009175 [Candidatus Magnetomorum sp. HK-1]|nr:hypothetical protein MHK_009175 [Candidatus Magnetomorum sp. HK-1]
MSQKPYIWITSLGQTFYENLNAYWAFCEKTYAKPERLVIFHAREITDPLQDLSKALQIVSKEYFVKEDIYIQTIPFDDENIHSFCENVTTVFKEAEKNKTNIVLDISPTTWSFVPVFFVNLSKQFQKSIKSILYLQYANHLMREKPYPLIPVNSLTLNNLITDIH